MADNKSSKDSSRKSRRGFLIKLAIGAAALAIVSTPAIPWIRKNRGRLTASKSNLPGGDSIFRPRDKDKA